MQLSEHLASCEWLRQHIPFPLANREKAWKTVLGNDPHSGLHHKLLPLQDNAQRHNPGWNTAIMKHKNAIALNRNYITRTIYNSKAKCLWSACLQILNFFKSFFWQLPKTLIYCVGCELSMLQANGDKMYKAIQINPILFFRLKQQSEHE